MRRVGYLMEKMMVLENFIDAERQLKKNKRKNKRARYISDHAEEYGEHLFEKVKNGTFQWHKPREATISESYKGKKRNLKIPCLEDQAAQLAWLNIAQPYIERRNYFYNCGSIPNAGGKRAIEAVKKWLKDPRYKYAATTDIRKFYETCPHSTIRKGLERIFKDKAFIDYAMGFVSSMSDTDSGIAIGYPVSHWLANVALMELDHEMKRKFPKVKMARYMDDVAMTSTNRRLLKKAVMYLKSKTESLGMELKKWAIYKVKDTGFTFLSFRFFNGYTLMTKGLMVRIARRMKKAKKHLYVHVARGLLSYFGIMEYCNSYNFRKKYVYPYVRYATCIRIVSEYDKRKYEELLTRYFENMKRSTELT